MNYDAEMITLLLQAVSDGSLETRDRIQLIDDVFALVSGLLQLVRSFLSLSPLSLSLSLYLSLCLSLSLSLSLCLSLGRTLFLGEALDSFDEWSSHKTLTSRFDQ